MHNQKNMTDFADGSLEAEITTNIGNYMTRAIQEAIALLPDKMLLSTSYQITVNTTLIEQLAEAIRTGDYFARQGFLPYLAREISRDLED